MAAIEFSSLNQPVSPAEMRPFAPSKKWLWAGVILGTLSLLIIIPLSVLFIGDATYIATIMVLPQVLYILAAFGVPIGFYYYGMRQARHRALLKRFADANDMTYVYDVATDLRISEPLLFTAGHSQKILESISTKGEGAIEIANYRFSTGSGKNEKTHDHGYICIKLPRRVPHIVLDAKANNFLGRFSNLPIQFTDDQRLSLEGDFNNYFTLYAPKEYERDALYILTPNVMTMLIDSGRNYDVEIIADELYIYRSSHFTLTNPAVLEEAFKLANLFKEKFHMQTDYYADEKVGDRSVNLIAPGGAHLKRKSYTALGIAFFIFYLLAESGALEAIVNWLFAGN